MYEAGCTTRGTNDPADVATNDGVSVYKYSRKRLYGRIVFRVAVKVR
jgi:hypothetical protein